jgi:RNA polymerase sigma-70 factor (ECF subfamily)
VIRTGQDLTEIMKAAFATTNWSVVLAAGRGESTKARQALAALCEAYWYPVYAFVRRQGYGAEESRDLTQGYFLQLLEKEFLADVRPELGRFRAFLIVSVKHFLSNERDRERALKRGGGRPPVCLDATEAEDRYRFEPVESLTPERLFERRWAATVLGHALDSLRVDSERNGESSRFDRLKAYLTGDEPASSYREAAADLAVSEAVVKTAVHRLRRRYGELLRAEIARTVADPREVEEEIRYLLSTMADVPPA